MMLKNLILISLLLFATVTAVGNIGNEIDIPDVDIPDVDYEDEHHIVLPVGPGIVMPNISDFDHIKMPDADMLKNITDSLFSLLIPGQFNFIQVAVTIEPAFVEEVSAALGEYGSMAYYLGKQRFLIDVPQMLMPLLDTLPIVDFEPLDPNEKISNLLASNGESDITKLSVLVSRTAGAKKLAEYYGTLISNPSVKFTAISQMQMIVTFPKDISESVISFLSKQAGTVFIQPAVEIEKKNMKSFEAIVGTQTPNMFGLEGYDGSTEIIGVSDNGLDTDHEFFADASRPVPFDTIDSNHRKIIAYFTEFGSNTSMAHGTHVCGTVAGISDNSTDEINKFHGMAPGAKIAFASVAAPDGKFTDFSVYDVSQRLYDAGARIHSMSWGGHFGGVVGIGAYSNNDYEADLFAYEHPEMVMVAAAGNDGHNQKSTTGSPANAINVLAVGATVGPQESWDAFFVDSPCQFDREKTIEASCDAISFLTAELNQNPICHQLPTTLMGIYGTHESTSCKEDLTAYCGYLTNYAGSGEDLYNDLCSANDYYCSQCPSYGYKHQGDEYNAAVFSSTGPTLDGRLKPEISAHGMLRSARCGAACGDISEDKLVYMPGTSMATPAVSGTIALVRQYMKEKMSIANPKARDVKAILMSLTRPIWTNQFDKGMDTGYGEVQVAGLNRTMPLLKEIVLANEGDYHPVCVRAKLVNSSMGGSQEANFAISIVYTNPPRVPLDPMYDGHIVDMSYFGDNLAWETSHTKYDKDVHLSPIKHFQENTYLDEYNSEQVYCFTVNATRLISSNLAVSVAAAITVEPQYDAIFELEWVSPEQLKCPNNCSNHGYCNQGVCMCDDEHTANDCSIVKDAQYYCMESCLNGECIETTKVANVSEWICKCYEPYQYKYEYWGDFCQFDRYGVYPNGENNYGLREFVINGTTLNDTQGMQFAVDGKPMISRGIVMPLSEYWNVSAKIQELAGAIASEVPHLLQSLLQGQNTSILAIQSYVDRILAEANITKYYIWEMPKGSAMFHLTPEDFAIDRKWFVLPFDTIDVTARDYYPDQCECIDTGFCNDMPGYPDRINMCKDCLQTEHVYFAEELCAVEMCPFNCSGNGVCNMTSMTCNCDTGFHGLRCESMNPPIPCEFGTIFNETCVCDSTHTGPACIVPIVPINVEGINDSEGIASYTLEQLGKPKVYEVFEVTINNSMANNSIIEVSIEGTNVKYDGEYDFATSTLPYAVMTEALPDMKFLTDAKPFIDLPSSQYEIMKKFYPLLERIMAGDQSAYEDIMKLVNPKQLEDLQMTIDKIVKGFNMTGQEPLSLGISHVYPIMTPLSSEKRSMILTRPLMAGEKIFVTVFNADWLRGASGNVVVTVKDMMNTCQRANMSDIIYASCNGTHWVTDKIQAPTMMMSNNSNIIQDLGWYPFDSSLVIRAFDLNTPVWFSYQSRMKVTEEQLNLTEFERSEMTPYALTQIDMAKTISQLPVQGLVIYTCNAQNITRIVNPFGETLMPCHGGEVNLIFTPFSSMIPAEFNISTEAYVDTCDYDMCSNNFGMCVRGKCECGGAMVLIEDNVCSFDPALVHDLSIGDEAKAFNTSMGGITFKIARPEFEMFTMGLVTFTNMTGYPLESIGNSLVSVWIDDANKTSIDAYPAPIMPQESITYLSISPGVDMRGNWTYIYITLTSKFAVPTFPMIGEMPLPQWPQEIYARTYANPACPMFCTGHGVCNGTGVCECFFGWDGPACNEPKYHTSTYDEDSLSFISEGEMEINSGFPAYTRVNVGDMSLSSNQDVVIIPTSDMPGVIVIPFASTEAPSPTGFPTAANLFVPTGMGPLVVDSERILFKPNTTEAYTGDLYIGFVAITMGGLPMPMNEDYVTPSLPGTGEVDPSVFLHMLKELRGENGTIIRGNFSVSTRVAPKRDCGRGSWSYVEDKCSCQFGYTGEQCNNIDAILVDLNSGMEVNVNKSKQYIMFVFDTSDYDGGIIVNLDVSTKYSAVLINADGPPSFDNFMRVHEMVKPGTFPVPSLYSRKSVMIPEELVKRDTYYYVLVYPYITAIDRDKNVTVAIEVVEKSHAPLMVVAQIAPDADHFTIFFTHVTDMAGASINETTDCSKYLAPEVIASINPRGCMWKTGSQLAVGLNKDSDVFGFHMIRLRTEEPCIKGPGSNTTCAIGQTPLLPPLKPVDPEYQPIIPDVLAPCEPFVMKFADASSKPQAITIKYHSDNPTIDMYLRGDLLSIVRIRDVNATTVPAELARKFPFPIDVLNKHLEAQIKYEVDMAEYLRRKNATISIPMIEPKRPVGLFEHASQVRIPYSFLEGKNIRDFTVDILLTNSFGKSIQFSKEIQVLEGDAPTLSLPGGSSYTLPASAFPIPVIVGQSPCGDAGAVSFVWSVIEATPEFRTIFNRIQSRTSPTIILPSGILGGGASAIIKLEAFYTNTPGVKTFAKVHLHGKVERLSAIIMGGDRIHPASHDLRIDGSLSMDPSHMDGDLVYQWSCLSEGTECPEIDSQSEPILIVPSAQLSAGEFTYTLIVLKGNRTAQSSILVDIRANEVPIISIRRKDSPGSKRVLPEDRIIFVGISDQGYSFDAEFLWSVEGITTDLEECTYMGVDSMVLILEPNCFPSGVTFNVKFTASYPDKDTVSTSYELSTGSPPIGGLFEVTPASGSAASTMFNITAYGFEVDSSTITDDTIVSTLEYKLFMRLCEDCHPLFVGKSYEPQHSMKLPLPMEGNQIYLDILVSDIYGGAVRLTKAITVTIPTLETDEAEEALFEDTLSEIEKAKDLGDVSGTMSAVKSTISVVLRKAVDVSAGQSEATLQELRRRRDRVKGLLSAAVNVTATTKEEVQQQVDTLKTILEDPTQVPKEDKRNLMAHIGSIAAGLEDNGAVDEETVGNVFAACSSVVSDMMRSSKKRKNADFVDGTAVVDGEVVDDVTDEEAREMLDDALVVMENATKQLMKSFIAGQDAMHFETPLMKRSIMKKDSAALGTVTNEFVNATIPQSVIDTMGDVEVGVSITVFDSEMSLHLKPNQIVGEMTDFTLTDTNGDPMTIENLDEPISLQIPAPTKANKATCAYFDVENSKWSTKGLKTIFNDDNTVDCTTSHLTTFALLPPAPEEGSSLWIFIIIGVVVVAGVAVGVLFVMKKKKGSDVPEMQINRMQSLPNFQKNPQLAPTNALDMPMGNSVEV
ncbi:hypothetical protein PCE1_002198 [Barthelona sp. PCE]